MKLSDEKSIQGILEEMTLEEKLTVLTGESMFRGPAMEKYGIPSVYFLDGGTGANYMQMVLEAYGRLHGIEGNGEDALFGNFFARVPAIIECLQNPEKEEELTDEEVRRDVRDMRKSMEAYIPQGQLPGCFPPGIVFGATWDTENIYACARALGKEAHYYGIDVLLGTPNVNIHRDPLGGRLFEGYSEDPCLVSKLAPAFVRGIQDEGIVANVKHFAANNQETDRRAVNEHIPQRALEEIYLPGFKACVQEGGCMSVMSAYNAVNGEFCAHNRWLLTDTLKKEWGFEGFVVSDWGGAYDQAKAWNAGNDVHMPGPRGLEKAIQAVKDGTLKEEMIDEALKRYLRIILKMPVMTGRRYDRIDRKGSAQAAYDSVKEGAVLLKNENKTLPLDRGKPVCFFGEKSRQFLESGGGSANVFTSESTSLYETMKAELGEDKVTFGQIEEQTQTVIITAGVVGQEGFDRAEMDVDLQDRKMLKEAIAAAKQAGKRTVVILNVCGPVDVSDYVNQVDAILCVFIPGMEGGHAAADILLGKINPSGKLPVTFPKSYRDVPSCGNFPGRNQEVWYGEGIFVGYRYYDYRNVEPQYPFGYGLSYTTFEIGDVKADRTTLHLEEDERVSLSLTLKNTGNRTGKEVIQLYIGEKHPALAKPPKELKHFKKVEAEPGEEKTVSFTISKKDLESYDEVSKGWVVQPDTYTVFIGTSSRNIHAEVDIEAVGWDPFGFHEETPVGVIAATPGALDKLFEFCPKGIITRQAIELQVLFQATASLKDYWKSGIEGLLEMGREEKEEYYRQMLREMNKFHS